MDSKINGVAVVILPPGLSKEEVQVLFSSILGKLEAIHPEYKQNGGFLTILEPNDLFRVVNPVNAEIATLIMLSINQRIIVMFIAKCLTKNKKESQTKV